MDLDSNTKECTLALTWAESLHTNRGAMETAGRRRGWGGGGVGERWLTTSIPLQIVLKCTYRCRRRQNHPTMQTPFFISSRQEVSVQSIHTHTHTHTHTHMQTKKRWEPCHLSSEFIWFPFFLPALYSSMHCPCIRWQPPLLLKARVTAGAAKEGWGKALSKPPLSIVSLLSLLCFFFPWVFPFLVACVQEEGKNCKSP